MSDPRDEPGGEHTLFLEAAGWDKPPRVEGLEFVLVREDSAAAVILENLTVNERGFDEDATGSRSQGACSRQFARAGAS